MVNNIGQLMKSQKVQLKETLGKSYRHELLNNLFRHPYTKIEFVEKDMEITRYTASRLLDKISKMGLLTKIKKGKSYYYLNNKLIELFTTEQKRSEMSPEDIIDSVTN